MQADLRAYRDEMKGLAILWVVFFHAQLGLTGFVYDIQKIGYGGVDIFFFLSGFGLFHSLEREDGLKAYLKRRAGRLLPAYLPFCALWLCVMIPLYAMGTVQSVRMAMGNLLMLGYFASVPMISWYVSALAMSVLLAPFFYSVLKEEQHALRNALALLAAAFGLGLSFIGTDMYMAVSRLPIFLLGMLVARPVRGGMSAAARRLAGAVSFAVGLVLLFFCFDRMPETLNTYGMYWHPFVLIVPPLCAGTGWCLRKLGGEGRFFAPLRALGRASFEIFLFDVWIEVLGKQFGLADSPLKWAWWSLASIAAGLLYHWGVGRVLKCGAGAWAERSRADGNL